MRRRVWIIWTIAAALAVLAVMWVRSHRVADAIGYGQRFTGDDGGYRIRFASVRSSRGVVHFGAGYILPIFVPSASVREGLYVQSRPVSPSATRAPPAWSGLGFEYHRIDLTGGLVTRSFGVPYWFLIACAVAMLIVSWRRSWRARRAVGMCARCGYDLRESRDRCPECGTPIPDEAGTDNPRGLPKGGARQS